jgi:hypothetical protein
MNTIQTTPGGATRVTSAIADEAARPGFEARMASEGVKDFERAESGRYSNAVLQWHWEDWLIFSRAGVPA